MSESDIDELDDEYRTCPSCGAEIYDDGFHVLDRYDRKGLGYPECPDPANTSPEARS